MKQFKHKTLLARAAMTLLLALLTTFGAWAQTTVEIGDGTSTGYYTPIGTYYNYSITEQLYTADEIGMAGTITSISFYYAYSAEKGFPITVYMANVDAADLSTGISLAGADEVFNGTLSVTGAGWVTIDLDTPFAYNGTSNLLIGINKDKVQWFSGSTWQYTSVANMARYSQNDNDPYDTTTVPGTVTNNRPNIQIAITAGSGPVCDKPETLEASNVTSNSAVLTWTGGSGTYNVECKKSADTEWTSVATNITAFSKTITGLEEKTAYQARVQSVCDSKATSGWKTVSFTTKDPNAAPTNLHFSNITASSAKLSWTPGYQETSWTVKYKKSSETDYSDPIPVSGTPTLNLTGLEGLTTYNVQVFNGENPVSGNFTTAATFPYSQDFSGSGIPTGWAQYSGLLADVMNGTALTSSSYGWSNGTNHSVLDGNHIYANIYGTSCKKWIVTPAIPLGSNARLTFDVAYTAYSSSATDPQTTGTDDKFVVLISTDNMATWTILRQWDNAGSEYVLNELTPSALHLNFDLSANAGQSVIVAFYAESTVDNADNIIHVDNVVFEVTPSCEKPQNVAINYTGGLTAEVSWEGEASAYNIDVNGTVAENVTSPYTLTSLELSTIYNVKVQSNCGNSTSEWTNPVSFTTDQCMPEDMCEITFELTDSYGDGWNGAYIEVLDVATDTSLGHMTNENLNGTTGSGTNEVNVKTLRVCDGRDIQFVWHSGSYDDECSYVVTDVNGEVIFGGSNALSEPVNYTVNCTVSSCRKPTDLAASEIGNHSVVLGWTENGEATAWVVAYSTDGTTFADVDALTNPFTLTDLNPETEYSVKVRPVCDDANDKWSNTITFTTGVACPAPTNLAIEPTPNSATITWTSDNDDFDVWYRELTDPNNDFDASSLKNWTTIDADGDGYTWVLGSECGGIYLVEGGSLAGEGHNSSADMVTSGSYSNVSGVGALTPDNYLVSPRINLGGSITFWAQGQDASYVAEHFGVAVSTTGNTNAGDFTTIQEWTMTAKGTGAKGNPGTTRSGNRVQGTWYEYTVDLSAYSGQGYVAIRHFDCTDMFMLNVDDIVIEQPNYVEPEWIEGTTDENTFAITDLSPETTYEVQVRSNCGNENGNSLWAYNIFTTPSVNAVPYDLVATNVEATSATLNWTAFLDNYNVRYRTAAFQTSYFTDNFDDGDASDWTEAPASLYYWTGTSDYFPLLGYEGTGEAVYLISPELSGEYEEGSFLYFAYRHVIPSGSESAMVFKVGYSTTTADLEAFTWGDEITSTSSWAEFEEVIPAGTKYFAVQTTDETAEVGLVVDYFGVYAPAVEAGEWVELNNVTSPLDITGLTPDTYYEWQVQGICNSGQTEWSETATFTTWGVEDILFAKDGYATYYNSKRDVVLPAGMKAHVVTAGSTTLTYNKVADGDEENNVVPAGTAMLLQVEEAAADHSVSIYLAIPSVAAYTGTNLMFGSDVETTTTGGDKYYKLTYSSSGTNFGWYWGADNGGAFESPAHKAWLALGSSGAPSFLGLPDWDTTGIVPVSVNPEDGEWYTLQGMKVGKKPTTKGVYIHNGRKVLIP